MSRSADPAGEMNAAKGGVAGATSVGTQAATAGVGAAGGGVKKAMEARKARDKEAAEAKAKAEAEAGGGGDKNFSDGGSPPREG